MYEFIKTEAGWQVCWGPLPMAQFAEGSEDLGNESTAGTVSELILRRRAAAQRTVRRPATARRRQELVMS